MQPERLDRIVAVVIVAIASCVLVAATREAPSPSVASATAATAQMPPMQSTSVRAEAAAEERRRAGLDVQRPPLTTTDGRSLDTDGLSIAAFLTKVAPAARRGDAVAAYRMYQAEAMCASIAWRTHVDDSQPDAETRASLNAERDRMNEACVGVTPAQLAERFPFLDQAIRAGNPQAMIDYRMEGPNGRDLDEVDPRDPLVVTWKKNVDAYLRPLAAAGNHTAWALLAQDCESGLVVDRDPASAITWWTALMVSRQPKLDPRTVPFIDALVTQLPAADAQQAIDRGRALGLRYPSERRAG